MVARLVRALHVDKTMGAIALILALVVVVTYVPRLPFVRPGEELTAAERVKAESDFRGHLIQAIGGLVLAVGAYFTGRTFALNREGQITERFTRAVEQVADQKNLDIRLGGIYALERIARDSKTHYEPAMEVLTAYLRERGRWEPELESDDGSSEALRAHLPEETPDPRELRVDLRAVATILARRDRRHERPDYEVDLREVDLRRTSWDEAHLFRANLDRVNLYRASLRSAHLEEASLLNAHLKKANLAGTHGKGARLEEAHLQGAYLYEADLKSASLRGARLGGADLYGAHLEIATLDGANLEGASLVGAHLEGATLSGANLKNVSFAGADLGRARLDRAHLEGADLERALGLTREQLSRAFTDASTLLPSSIPSTEYPSLGALMVNAEGGARIAEVAEAGPAHRAGLRTDDLVVAAGGRAVESAHYLRKAIDERDPGDALELAVWRGDETLTIRVQLGTRTPPTD